MSARILHLFGRCNCAEMNIQFPLNSRLHVAHSLSGPFGGKKSFFDKNSIRYFYIRQRIFRILNFKYLGYRISEYKSDLEDKLQTYNKINGAIRRHFGKQMNKEIKLRIHNITAKAALKFISEAWVLKKREEQRLESSQMKFLRHLLGITKLDKEKNQ